MGLSYMLDSIPCAEKRSERGVGSLAGPGRLPLVSAFTLPAAGVPSGVHAEPLVRGSGGKAP